MNSNIKGDNLSDLDFDTTEIEPVGDEEEQMAEDAKVYAEYWETEDRYAR